MKYALTIGIVILAVPTAVFAAEFSQTDLSPLIRVHDRQLNDATTAISLEDRDLFISRGGAMESLSVTICAPAGCRFSTRIARGVASPVALTTLNNSLSQARIRFQEGGCHLKDFPSSQYHYELTWYGLGGRSNTLAIANTFQPECSVDLEKIVVAVNALEFEVLDDPGTEILTSRSGH